MDSSLQECERKNNSGLAPGSCGSPGAERRCAVRRDGWNFIFPPTPDTEGPAPGFSRSQATKVTLSLIL